MKPRFNFIPLAVVALTVSLSLNVRAEDGWQHWFKDGLGDAKVVSGQATYKVENGVLIGTTTEGSSNTFLTHC